MSDRTLRRRGVAFVGVLAAFTLVAGVAAAAAGAAPRQRANKPATRPAPSTTDAPTTTSAPATTTTGLATTTTMARATTTTTAPAPATTVAPPASSASAVRFGAATAGGPADLSGLTTFEADAGKPVSLYTYYKSFGFDPNFDAPSADAVRAHGATPVITWEPWDPSSGSADQPEYSLSRIASGAHDDLIGRWATQMAAYGKPVWLRFAHEMNGDWYPWAASVNGNSPAQYVAAWRHVHDIFVAAGATNVTWVWSPNVIMGGGPALSSLYPGDGYVDWVGVDGYNWGSTASWSSWQTPEQLFGPTLAALTQLSSRPVVIAETASTEVGGNKAQWVQQFFTMLGANPQVQAFVWFNLSKETDWRIESSPSAQSAFASAVADPRYR